MKPYVYGAATVLTLLGLMLIPLSVTQVSALTPTPTQVTYSKSDLLSKLAAKPYTITDMNLNYGSPGDLGADGGSWFLTFQNIWSDTNALSFILGWLLVLVVVATLINVLRRSHGKEMKQMGEFYIQPTRLSRFSPVDVFRQARSARAAQRLYHYRRTPVTNLSAGQLGQLQRTARYKRLRR